MALTCTEIGKLVHPYLDGEFSDEDRVALEQHTAECSACRELVQYEMAFKGAMRAKLALPRAPSALRAKVMGSLDELDRISDGDTRPALWARLLPTTAVTAAAAAIALFFLVPSGARAPAPAVAVAPAQPEQRNPFIAAHQVRPIAVAAADPDAINRIERDMSRRVGVRVRVPKLQGVERSAMTARVTNLRGRDAGAAQFSYVLLDRETGRRHDLSVTIFDPTGVRVPGKTKRRVGTTEILCDSDHGYHSVYYKKDGVGYVLSSGSLDEDQLVQLASSDIGH